MSDLQSVIQKWNMTCRAVVNTRYEQRLPFMFEQLFSKYWKELSVDAYVIGQIFTPLVGDNFLKTDDKTEIAEQIYNILKQHDCIGILIRYPKANDILEVFTLQSIVCLMPNLMLTDFKNSTIAYQLWKQTLDCHPYLIKMFYKINDEAFTKLVQNDIKWFTRLARDVLTPMTYKQFKKRVDMAKIMLGKGKQRELEF